MMEITTVGFLGIEYFQDGAIRRGAILVTDTETKPLEFRYTAPVCPENFQAILYGELLDEHIAVELIGLTLLKAIDNKPDLVLVCNELLLGVSSKQDIPTLGISRTDETWTKRGIKAQGLERSYPDQSPTTVYILEGFVDDLKSIAEQLQVIFAQRDLMEPFERLKNACIDVHGHEQKNK